MPKTILVVDDDPLVLNSLSKLFKREGYGIATASSGKEALEIISSSDFDLVIVDIRMSELDGVDTVRNIKEIRKKQAKPDIPVIFITGYADIEANQKAEKFGEVVCKPFDLEELLNRVKTQSSKRRVVITGLGVVAPNGIGKNAFWQASITGKSGIDFIAGFDASSVVLHK